MFHQKHLLYLIQIYRILIIIFFFIAKENSKLYSIFSEPIFQSCIKIAHTTFKNKTMLFKDCSDIGSPIFNKNSNIYILIVVYKFTISNKAKKCPTHNKIRTVNMV